MEISSATKILKGLFCGSSIDKQIKRYTPLRGLQVSVYGSRFFVLCGRYFFRYQIPCMNFFFFLYFARPSPYKFSNGPSLTHNKRKCTAQVTKYFVDYQDWKYADERHRWKETVIENARFRFCGQTRAFRYEIVFRGIQPCFLPGGGGALGYFLGGYVPPGTPNWHPVLKTNSPKIDTPF